MSTKETTSEVLKDIEIAIRINDPATLVNGCGCDPTVNQQCEACFTFDALRRAKREIERLTEPHDDEVPGLHAHRLNQDNPREVAFADQWALEHAHHDILKSLCAVECDRNDAGAVRIFNPFGTQFRKYPIGSLTKRDRTIAATLIQWLGSNVGMSFLRESLRRCGYKIVNAFEQ